MTRQEEEVSKLLERVDALEAENARLASATGTHLDYMEAVEKERGYLAARIQQVEEALRRLLNDAHRSGRRATLPGREAEWYTVTASLVDNAVQVLNAAALSPVPASAEVEVSGAG